MVQKFGFIAIIGPNAAVIGAPNYWGQVRNQVRLSHIKIHYGPLNPILRGPGPHNNCFSPTA